MKNRAIKILLFIVAALVCMMAIFIAITYPPYHNEMQAAKKRLIINSEILKTEHEDIEYTVRGEGKPVLLLHGAPSPLRSVRY